jgi:hypothetical protein
MRVPSAIFLLILSFSLEAQEVRFTAAANPAVLRVGEQVNLTYTSNQELEEINIPEIRDFELLGGPSQGHSQSVFSENGKVTTTSSWQYTYFFRAIKEGKFTISPATVKIKGKVYASNPVTIEVVKAREQTPPQNQGGASQGSSQTGKVSDKDLYVSLIPDKREAYIGEPIVATVKLFTRVNLLGVDQNFKGPDYTGFFTEPVEVPPLRNLEREAVNGEIYGTGVLRKVVIIPQKSGELVIQPFELDVSLRQEVRRRIDSFFEDFTIPDVQEVRVKIKSKAVKINVKPLPGGAPPSFKGAVGNFRLTSSLNKTTTSTHDPLTLKVVIRGRGNLRLINEIDVTVPYDMEKYDPVMNTQMDGTSSGSRTFEYLLMPRVPGQFSIPPAEFTYFDPEGRQYRTLKTESYQVTVEKGQGDTLVRSMPGIDREDVKLLNQDIAYIRTNSIRLIRTDSFYLQSPVYYLIYVLLLLVFFALIWNRNRLVRQHADVAGLRLRRADQYARRRLKKSAVLLKQGDASAFYEELLGAIWGYLSDKLRIPRATLSRESAGKALQERGVEQERIDRLFSLTETCEMARYARGLGDISRDKLYQDTLETITGIQQKLK